MLSKQVMMSGNGQQFPVNGGYQHINASGQTTFEQLRDVIIRFTGRQQQAIGLIHQVQPGCIWTHVGHVDIQTGLIKAFVKGHSCGATGSCDEDVFEGLGHVTHS